ncbi:hypothetical protein AB6D11_00740 [Vibrio splendidus]
MINRKLKAHAFIMKSHFCAAQCQLTGKITPKQLRERFSLSLNAAEQLLETLSVHYPFEQFGEPPKSIRWLPSHSSFTLMTAREALSDLERVFPHGSVDTASQQWHRFQTRVVEALLWVEGRCNVARVQSILTLSDRRVKQDLALIANRSGVSRDNRGFVTRQWSKVEDWHSFDTTTEARLFISACERIVISPFAATESIRSSDM